MDIMKGNANIQVDVIDSQPYEKTNLVTQSSTEGSSEPIIFKTVNGIRAAIFCPAFKSPLPDIDIFEKIK